MKLIAIRIDNYINFEKYLHYLDKTSVVKIMSFYQRRDKIIAFTSEILKKYYLAKVLAIEPTDIKIGFNAYGKPILLNTKYKIDFNISHSGDYVIMAIVYNAGIGIDIEQINHAIKPQELGKYVFSTKELALVSDDIGSFYLMWTKKEALIKAMGTGFLVDTYKTTQLTLNPLDILSNQISVYSSKIFTNYYFAIALTETTVVK